MFEEGTHLNDKVPSKGLDLTITPPREGALCGGSLFADERKVCRRFDWS